MVEEANGFKERAETPWSATFPEGNPPESFYRMAFTGKPFPPEAKEIFEIVLPGAEVLGALPSPGKIEIDYRSSPNGPVTTAVFILGSIKI